MSDELGTYSFLPWLRLGLANQLKAADGDGSVKLRATIEVKLDITGRPVEGDVDLKQQVKKDVALYGPGDITGIEPRAIVKVEPRHWITNFEPNYMPYIEFYEEDFPWRYTPAAPDLARNRLRPWLTLLVLKEGEFNEVAPISSRPCAAIEVTGQADQVFPPADQLWAWAHVHINKDMIQQDGVAVSTDMDAARPRIESLLESNPDHAYSRLLCPRTLEENVSYHAFLIPTFESGRLAGLGHRQAAPNAEWFATQSAWEDYADRPLGALHPVYRRWQFKTGSVGDFEYLVRLLKPRPADARLGRRDMDTQDPAPNIAGIASPELGGVLRLGGALKVPDEVLSDAQEAEAEAYDQWDQPSYPHAFQEDLARFINLPDDYRLNGSPDPVITAPLYGRWHALTERLLFDADGSDAPQRTNWVHRLNLDPRWRVPAAFGTTVVQKNQEEYMDAAWGQVGEIIEANRRIRLAQVAREVGLVWHGRHLGPALETSVERGLALMAPVQRRVVANGFTVRHTIATSTVPRAALSAPLRRILRPRDHLAATLGFDSPKGAEGLIERINQGEISAAPPRDTPADLPTVEEVAEALGPGGVTGGLAEWLRTHTWLKWLLLAGLLLLALLLLVFVGLLPALAAAGVAVALFLWLAWLERQAAKGHATLPEGNAPEVIEGLPSFPDFEVRPYDTTPGAEPTPGASDSVEAGRLKDALIDVYVMIDTSETVSALPERKPIDLPGLAGATYEAIDPAKTVPAYTIGGITIPPHLVLLNGEVFREAMAYPEIDLPMYKPLLELSNEHFLPNIDKIPPNTITMLETNQRFIEAYMVGLNHEFARELLWREFPTDQRGSCFRQFWDVSEVIDKEGLSKEALREKLRDIPPLHTWSRYSNLGDHDHREQPGEKEDEVVLVIRGELLKKYPTAVIYAQKARWQRKQNGDIDRLLPRLLETDDAAGEWLKLPLYTAKADPDITFIGFDLKASDAKGGDGADDNDPPGWFFVIKERPGEPRFGLDIGPGGGPLHYWNDLAWGDVPIENGFLQLKTGGPTHELTAPPPGEPAEKQKQHEEDKQLKWHPGTNAAELAYILYQVPVLVAVHGSEMLPD